MTPRKRRQKPRRRPDVRTIFEALEGRLLLAASPILSEFVADNTDLVDGDGRTPDWIEIYNAGDETVNLAGWHLTDSTDDKTRWTFPSKTLGRGEFVVVFASGEDVEDYVDPAGYLHTNFKLNPDGGYLALVRPDLTLATEFASYPQQRTDVAFGATQSISTTTLLEEGAAGKMLVPTAADDAAIGSTWTGGAAFDDSTWRDVTFGVGYGSGVETVPQLQNVALNKPASTNGTLYSGMTPASLTNGNRFDVVHGDGPGGNTGVHETAGFKYEINLGASHALSRIDVFPRQDGCCPNRLTNYRVSVHLDNNGSIGAQVWSADMRTNGSFPAAGPTPPDTLTAALNAAGTFEGQWIRIQSLQNPIPDYALQLGEVEVYAMVDVPVNELNAAFHKTVTTSGPLYPNFPDPQIITDGNRGTFTHPLTPVSTFSYTIDLGAMTAIDHINIVNRGDGCCPERLSRYHVSIHADDDGEFGLAVWSADVRADGSNSGPAGVDLLTADLDAAGQFEGRFVVVEKLDTGSADYWPQIAEVEVFPPAGYGDAIATNVELSMLNINASAYFRAMVPVADAGAFDSLTFSIRDDDGFVAYLNGTEIARRNAPVGTPAFDATATATHHASAMTDFAVPVGLLHNGNNILAIHGLNVSADNGDFLILPELKARSVSTSASGYLLVPTPGAPNGSTVIGFVADTAFDVDRGFFDSPFDVQITTPTPGATLIYTTDGSAPTLSHGTAVAPADPDTPPAATVHISTTTTLRAAAFKAGYQQTNVDTQTYLFLNDVIHQPALPDGYPSTWNGFAADYEMDPDVVNNPLYANDIIAGLKSIPTMSLVMDPDDFLGPTDGIYTFPERIGINFERPVSIEVINPDGSTLFQENAGVRVWGTGWRPHSSTPKHALQLKFKDQYGKPKLDSQLFPDAPVNKFDDIILRSQGSRSWLDFREGLLERDATQYIHDAWARDTAAEMGKVEGHATFVNLYINGLYWGLYNPVERATGNFGEEYFGGESGDYDVISHRVGEPMVANEGDLVAWNQVMALADAGLASAANYQQIQQLVDLDNLIDYMLINQYATNHDGPSGVLGYGGNNTRMLRKREPGGQFRFFVWDMEYTFWNATENTNITDVDFPNVPGHLFTKLRENIDFRQRFADRAKMHLTGNGALTPARAAARWQARADQLYTAIIGESARWGDYRRPSQPYTRNVEWTNELNRLKTQYFPVRTQILIDQLKAAGLYFDAATPTFNQQGGTVPAGFELTMSAPASPKFLDSTLIASGAAVRALVPANGDLGQTWTQKVFDDSTWMTGTTGVGFDNVPAVVNYNPLIGLDIGVSTPSTNEPTSVYTRINFNVADPTQINKLTLRMKYDDGYVAYLNGTEVARKLAPGAVGTPPAYNARATNQRTDAQSIIFEDVDITAFKGLLSAGQNVLAIHGLNLAPNNPDFLLIPELIARLPDPNNPPPPIYYTTDGSDPRASGGSISPAAQLYTRPIPIVESSNITARVLESGVWGAPNRALFTVTIPLRISEIMYNPPANPNAEFIELLNIGPASINLNGMTISDCFDFTFGNVTLQPGQRAVIVKNQAAFESVYGTAIPIAAIYTGSLDNSGETITLKDPAGGVIQSFTFEDSGQWPGRPDGGGSSLEVVDPAGNYNDPANFRASYEYNGTPGAAGAGPNDDVVVNEVLSHSVLPEVDAIELHNNTPNPVDLSGWFLSDSSNYAKYRIPDGTTLPALGYLTFDETDFNPTPGAPAPNDFALNGAHGDDVWLLKAASDGTLLAFADHIEFDAAGPGESIGRYPDGTGPLYALATLTLDAPNSPPRIGPAIISEVMYKPALADDNLEYIEVQNVTDAPLDLSGWMLDRGVTYAFAQGTALDSHEPLLVVHFDPAESALAAAFRSHYGLDSSIPLTGPYQGELSDNGEALRLARPDVPPADEPDFTPYLSIDFLNYSALAPWPDAAGTGASLSRQSRSVIANDAANWSADPPTAGSVPFGHAYFQGGTHFTYAAPFTTLDSLTLKTSSQVTVAPGGHTLIASSVDIDSTSRLDLADNDLILRATPSTRLDHLATLSSLIASGRAAGAWTGNGIISSAAAANLASLTGLAILLNDNGEGDPIHNTFSSIPVGVDDILIKYTWNGDADLNGLADADDYFLIDSGFASQSAPDPIISYHTGDFDYSQTVDADDYFLIDSAFAGQSSPLALPIQRNQSARISLSPGRMTRKARHHSAVFAQRRVLRAV